MKFHCYMVLFFITITFQNVSAQINGNDSTHLNSFNKLIFKSTSSFVSRSMNDCIRTITGGYAITQFSGNECYVAVFDSSFNILFTRLINVQNNHKSAGFSIAQSPVDSSFCIAGITSDPSRPEYDLLIARIDKYGNEKSIDSYLYDNANGGDIKILALKNGRFLIAAEGHGTVGLIDIDVNGKIFSVKSLSYQNNYLLFNDIVATQDEGYLLTGAFDEDDIIGNPRDIYCVKIDSALIFKWAKAFSSGKLEDAGGLVAASDGNFFVCGSQADNINAQDFRNRFFVINNKGKLLWHKLSKFSSNGFPSFAVETDNTGFVMGGVSTMFKVAKNGNLVWISNQQISISYGLIKTQDKGFVTFQEYNPYQFNIIKIDSTGKSCNADYTVPYNELQDSLSEKSITFTVDSSTIQYIQKGVVFTNYDTSVQSLCEPVLALQLIVFTATPVNNQTILSWHINDNSSTSKFIIERSADANNFVSIGSCLATSQTNYSFTDKQPLPGNNFYRLKVINADGKIIYSDIKLIKLSAPKISLYPNPVKNTLQIIADNTIAENVSIEITNIEGTVLNKLEFKSSITGIVKTIDVSNLTKGIYFIKLISPGRSVVMQFEKQ